MQTANAITPRTVLVSVVGPTAVVVGVLVSDYALYGTPATGLVRSLSVILPILWVAHCVLILTLRRADLVASLSTVAVLLCWGTRETLFVGAFISLGVMLVLVAGLFRSTPRIGMPRFAARMRILSVAFAAASLVTLATSGSLRNLMPTQAIASEGSDPSIYVMLLDGYPGRETLARWGFDNDPFLEALQDRGFDVARDASSNYTTTQHSLPSILYMQHLADIEALSSPPDDLRGRLRLLSQVIAGGGTVVEYLRERGYEISTVPSPVGDVTIWSAGRLGPPHLSDYEIHLLTDTALGRLLFPSLSQWVAAEQRASVEDAFATLVAEQRPHQFVWLHVMSPHRPYVFKSNGEPRPLQECLPECSYWAEPRNNARQQQIEQVAYLNLLVIDAVDKIDRDAVLVIMSDHGTGLGDVADGFRNLLAVRAPGHPDLIPLDATPVTLFPRIFNAYFDADLPIPRNDHFVSKPQTRLELTPWP